jgi:hypothetical protein
MRRRKLLVALAALAVVVAAALVVDSIGVEPATTDRRESSGSDPVKFFYMGGTVGYFEDAACPQAAGRYRYMADRSGAHYEIQLSLRNRSHPRCALRAQGRSISFAVIACPEYGVLELAEFRDEDGDPRPARESP